MIKVIINADDLGLNPIVNNTIDEALSNGFITSSTILANSNYLEDVKRIILKHPNASFGIHLNLTEGKSLTQSSIFTKFGIIDESGCFVKKQSLKVCPNADKELKEAIKKEWMAQVDLLLKSGINLSHADGHHHCHSWYGLADVLIYVIQFYKLSKTRQRSYIYPEKLNGKYVIKDVIARLCNLLGLKLYKFNNSFSSHFASTYYTLVYGNILRKNDITTTDYFCSYNDMYEIFSSSKLRINDGDIIELMCHPGSIRYAEEYNNIKIDKIGIRRNVEYQQISYKEL